MQSLNLCMLQRFVKAMSLDAWHVLTRMSCGPHTVTWGQALAALAIFSFDILQHPLSKFPASLLSFSPRPFVGKTVPKSIPPPFPGICTKGPYISLWSRHTPFRVLDSWVAFQNRAKKLEADQGEGDLRSPKTLLIGMPRICIVLYISTWTVGWYCIENTFGWCFWCSSRRCACGCRRLFFHTHALSLERWKSMTERSWMDGRG